MNVFYLRCPFFDYNVPLLYFFFAADFLSLPLLKTSSYDTDV